MINHEKRIIYYLFFCLIFEVKSQQLIDFSNISDTVWVGKPVIFNSLQPNKNIILYYSTDDGNSWETLANNFNALYIWEVPFTLNKQIVFKAIKKDTVGFELIWHNKFAHTDEIRSIDFSPDGKYVLTYSTDGWLKVWDIANKIGIDSLVISGEEYLYDAKFYKTSGKILYSVGANTFIWDRNKKSTKSFFTTNFDSFIRKIDVNPQKTEFATVTNDIDVNSYDNENYLPNYFDFSSAAEYGNAYDIRYSNDGKYVGIPTYNGKIIINDLDNYNSNYKVDSKPIYSLCFLNDNNNVAFGGASTKLQFYDRVNRSYDTLVPSFKSAIRDIKYSQSRNEVYASSTDSTLKIWNVETKQKFPLELNEPYQILTFDITQTSDTIATSGRENEFRIWKNYQILEEVELDTFVCMQEVFFKISTDIHHPQPNEKINAFVEISAKYQDTLRKLDWWEVHTEIRLPISSVFDSDYEDLIEDLYYSFDVDSNFVFSPNYFWEDSFKSLYFNKKSEVLIIDTVIITPEDNFYPIIKSDSVQIEYYCENYSSFEFVQIPKITQVVKNNNFIQCFFDEDIDNNTEILVFDYSGKVYSNTFYYFASSEELIIENINSGLIFVLLKNKNYTISLKLYSNK